MLHDLVAGQIGRGAESLCVDDRAGAEFESLESLVGLGNVRTVEDDTVVFHDDGLVLRILHEGLHDLFSEEFASREGIFSESDRAAHCTGLRDDAGVRNLVDDTESHQSRRMCVDY